MSHSVKITLIGDQEIKFNNKLINVHDIISITIDSNSKIIDVYLIEDKINHLKTTRNLLSKRINEFRRDNINTDNIINEMKKISTEIKELSK